MLRKLQAVYIFAENVRESASWYSNVLGVSLEIDEISFALIKLGEFELCFHQADYKSPSSTGGSVGYWFVDDLLKSAEAFIKNGGKFYRGPIEIEGTREGICQIIDPYGNIIGLQGVYSKKY